MTDPRGPAGSAASAGPAGPLGPVADVLVLRALGLGDLLTAVPALRGVRRAWPGATLHLAGPRDAGEWLRSLGVVDAVIPTEGLDSLDWDVDRSGHGDGHGSGHGPGHVAVNLHGRGPQSHRLLAATRPARLVAFACGEFPGPQWRDDEHEVVRWCRLLRSAGGRCGPEDLRLDVDPVDTGPLHRGDVLLHPGAGAPSRRWPAERWAALASALVHRGHRVVLTGSARERRLCAAIRVAATSPVGEPEDLSGELDVRALAARVAAAGLVVCGDTGVGHLATAVGTRSVLLFGPTAPDLWGPAIDGRRHLVLWHGEPLHRGDPHGATTDPALARISVDEVLGAVDRLLARAA